MCYILEGNPTATAEHTAKHAPFKTLDSIHIINIVISDTCLCVSFSICAADPKGHRLDRVRRLRHPLSAACGPPVGVPVPV